MLGGDERRVRLVYSLMFSLPGTPTLFYGEEIGMRENPDVEGRLAVRTPMQWDAGPNAQLSTEGLRKQFGDLAKTAGRKVKKAGDAVAIPAGARTIVADYEVPFLAHAAMEPLNCTVELQGDGAEIWVGSQFQGVDQPAAAKALGIDPSKVKLNTVLAGGGFGRRANPASDYVIEACEIARCARRVERGVARLRAPTDGRETGFVRSSRAARALIAERCDVGE
jgi:isoquinoline 1-oxidoreductase beta subunit